MHPEFEVIGISAIESMAEKIIELINQQEKGKEFGESIYKLVKEMCDLVNYGEKIVPIYNNLIK